MTFGMIDGINTLLLLHQRWWVRFYIDFILLLLDEK